MADSESVGGCLGILLLAGAGWWIWNDHNHRLAASTAVVPPVSPPASAAPLVNAAAPAALPPTPPPLTHRYDFEEGDVYGYIAAVTEEERKRGQAAGDVVMFRYLGYRDQKDRLQILNGAKEVEGIATCTRPCVAIEEETGGAIKRLAYSSDSLVGAALQDAVNGQLMKVRFVAATPKVEPQAQTISENDPASNALSQ